jgi:hypothetical protein
MKDISHLSKHLSYCLLAKAATMNPQKRRRTTTAPAAQASHGDTKTQRKLLDRNADVLVGISTS